MPSIEIARQLQADPGGEWQLLLVNPEYSPDERRFWAGITLVQEDRVEAAAQQLRDAGWHMERREMRNGRAEYVLVL